MKTILLSRVITRTAIGLSLCLAALGSVTQAATPIYATQFERSGDPELDYDPAFELIGQAGWTGLGTGGSGLLEERFPGQGQQAYLGFFPPLNEGENFTSAWQPLNYDPLAEQKPIVRFKVTMEIVDSLNGFRDDFRWTVYNQDEEFLFLLDFDNLSTGICYALNDGNGIQPTAFTFVNDTIYELEIIMDFENNLWSADLSGTVVVENQPISAGSAALTLGDIDAVWFIFDPDNPGDNFMAFDNYEVTAEAPVIVPPEFGLISRLNSGEAVLRLKGEVGKTYRVDATSNLKSWTQVRMVTLENETEDIIDSGSVGLDTRFYRAVLME